MRLKLCLYSRNLKTLRIWLSSVRSLEFFKTQNFNKISRMHLNFFLLKSSQNVQKLVFSGNKDVFLEKNLIFRKSLTLAKFLWIAFRIVFLLKSSQNVENWFFFSAKKDRMFKIPPRIISKTINMADFI